MLNTSLLLIKVDIFIFTLWVGSWCGGGGKGLGLLDSPSELPSLDSLAAKNYKVVKHFDHFKFP